MNWRATIRVSMGLAALLPFAVPAAQVTRQEYVAVVRAKINLDHGAEIFRTCAACHGPDGSGVQDGTVPRIAGQYFRVLAKQLVDFRHDKRWDIRMEHFTDRHLLPDAQAVADVAGYVSQLESSATPGIGKGDLVEKGAALYAARCQSCHGRDGEGNGDKLVPHVAGQHYEYVMRQIYDAVDGRRPNFSREHISLLAKLERDDVLGLADFLSRSSWSNPIPSNRPAR